MCTEDQPEPDRPGNFFAHGNRLSYCSHGFSSLHIRFATGDPALDQGQDEDDDEQQDGDGRPRPISLFRKPLR